MQLGRVAVDAKRAGARELILAITAAEQSDAEHSGAAGGEKIPDCIADDIAIIGVHTEAFVYTGSALLGLGTFGGSEDQTAILCCRAGEISQYAFRPVRHERSVPLHDDWAFVVASSGMAAESSVRNG